MQWRTMDSAPRDGMKIRGMDPYHTWIMFFKESHGWVSSVALMGEKVWVMVQPIGWLPLNDADSENVEN